MNKLQFLQLLSKGESESLELKASFDKETIETLTAFANTKGGNITFLAKLKLFLVLSGSI